MHSFNATKRAWLVLLSVTALCLWTGCATTIYVRPGSDFSFSGKAKLLTQKHDTLSVVAAKMDGDSLRFLERDSIQESALALSQVESLTEKRRGLGAIQGGGIGFFAGFTGISLGMAYLNPDCEDEEVWCIELNDDSIALMGLFGGLTFGVPVGTLAGAIRGADKIYRFEEKPKPGNKRPTPAQGAFQPLAN